jgi:hypothetical protein
MKRIKWFSREQKCLDDLLENIRINKKFRKIHEISHFCKSGKNIFVQP